MGDDVDLVLLVTDYCRACDAAKESVAGDKRVRVVDAIKSGEGQRIVKALGIEGVPTLVLVRHGEKFKTVCELDQFLNVKRCAEEEP